jgi:hypothetical protein
MKLTAGKNNCIDQYANCYDWVMVCTFASGLRLARLSTLWYGTLLQQAARGCKWL